MRTDIKKVHCIVHSLPKTIRILAFQQRLKWHCVGCVLVDRRVNQCPNGPEEEQNPIHGLLLKIDAPCVSLVD